MPPDGALPGLLRPAGLASLIELAGALGIVACCAAALWAALRGQGPERARLLVIEGALWGLGFKTAATLLKTVELRDWHGILAFTAVLALRTVLKRVMAWEEGRLDARQGAGVSPPG